MNNKHKRYKEYLKLSNKMWDAKFNSTEYHFCQNKIDHDNQLYALKRSYYYGSPQKEYINKLNKSDRLYNKQVLKHNLSNSFKEIRIDDVDFEFDSEQSDDHFVWRWKSRGIYWEEDEKNYRYKHRNNGKWLYW